jgi:dinuclear metal center YbgI/SA1388 family protein
VGLLVGESAALVAQALVALELTEEVLDEALATGCNTIVCHHPIWFGKRTRLTDSDWVGRLLLRAIRANLHLVAVHTNLDNVPTGVNLKMAERLGLQQLQILHPNPAWTRKTDDAETHFGAGMLGQLPRPMPKADFLRHVKQAFGCEVIRYADAPLEAVETVAVCGGSGSFLLGKAVASGAHAFITGDVTHHKFFDAGRKLLFLDIGHWESEQFTSELIADYLKHKFPNFAVRLSSVRTNPVSYHF